MQEASLEEAEEALQRNTLCGSRLLAPSDYLPASLHGDSREGIASKMAVQNG